MTIFGWYLALGWAFTVLWIAMEYHRVRAKRLAGVYPRMTWREYALVPFALLIGWPLLAAVLVRSVIHAWRVARGAAVVR